MVAYNTTTTALGQPAFARLPYDTCLGRQIYIHRNLLIVRPKAFAVETVSSIPEVLQAGRLTDDRRCISEPRSLKANNGLSPCLGTNFGQIEVLTGDRHSFETSSCRGGQRGSLKVIKSRSEKAALEVNRSEPLCLHYRHPLPRSKFILRRTGKTPVYADRPAP